MTVLERVRWDLVDNSEIEPWTLVRKPDLAALLAVVEAASDAVGSVDDKQYRKSLYEALAELDKP